MNLDNEEIRKLNSNSMKNLHNSKRQLLFNMDKNRYYLKYDDNSKIFESNIFALKTPQVNVPQTGFAKYNDRILTNSVEKLNFKVDNSLYHPQSLRFEGYTQFPRPLIIPFSNISKIKLQKNLLNDLKKTEYIFTTDKNKNILNKKTNTGLSFYSGTINNIVNKKNKKLILNKINEALSYDENENLFSNKEKVRDYEKNALRKLKNKIISNSTNIIFGRKLKKPDDKFINQFNINYNILFNNPIKKNKIKNSQTEPDNKNYFEELYNALNKKSIRQKLIFPKKKLNLDIDDNNTNNTKKTNNIKNKNTDNEITKNTLHTEEKVLSPNSQINDQSKSNNNNKDTYKPDTIKTFFNSINIGNNTKYNTIDYESKVNYKDIVDEENENKMYISLDNEKLNHENNNIFNIKTLYDLNKNCSIEKKLLKGFNKPKIKEATYRKAVPKYKSTINIYKKEWELYKLVNPIRYKLDEEQKLKELKLIQEKLEKGKDFVSFSLPKSRKNKFFAT